MFAREFGLGQPLPSFILGLALFAFGGSVFAATPKPPKYWGDDLCANCHEEQYATYQGHGHPWHLVQTPGPFSVNSAVVDDAPDPWLDGNPPPADLYPWGVPLPQLPAGVDWSMVEYIVGNPPEGLGSVVLSTGYRDLAGKSSYSCGKCHTTGYNATGHQKNHLGVEMAGAVGTWAFNGIQCEVCHGANMGMAVPPSTRADPTKSPKFGEPYVCRDCHTGDLNGLPFAASTTGPGGLFTSHHPQGDELAYSPHKNLNQGCAQCHDPHRSVWHDDGGVRTPDGVSTGNMCTQCHDKQVRGVMGPVEQGGVGLECIDCHMPDVSSSGTRAAHLFKISPDPTKSAATNTVVKNGKKYWDTDNNPALTLDLVCISCHPSFKSDSAGMNAMSKVARTIHREIKVMDLTVNHNDSLQVVQKKGNISVDFSVDTSVADGSSNLVADWYVMCQGPSGKWTSWDGKKWKSGIFPFLKKTKPTDIATRNVFKGTLTPGFYTYWAGIVASNPSDPQEFFDSVQVYVKR